MSAVAYYDEPNKLSAGILALLVHGVFFALLGFGFSWQTTQPAAMSVDLWQSLPDAATVPHVQPKVEAVVQPPQPEEVIKPEAIQPPQPEEIIKPDIVLPDKKKTEAKPVTVKPEKKKPAPIPEKKVETKPAKQEIEARIAEQVAIEQAEQAALARAEQAAHEQAAQAAAVGRVVDEYIGKIAAKIRRNIVLPPDVADDARAEFLVTVLPGGTVLNPRLLKSSGNAAYDNAVERAILKSQPLPLPADMSLFSRFRELRLGFEPEPKPKK